MYHSIPRLSEHKKEKKKGMASRAIPSPSSAIISEYPIICQLLQKVIEQNKILCHKEYPSILVSLLRGVSDICPKHIL